MRDRVSRRPVRRGTLVVLALSGAACCVRGKAVDATPADTARARAACRQGQDYKPDESVKVRKSFDEYCDADGERCPSRRNIAEVCSFYGPRTPQRTDVYTTLLKSDDRPLGDLCETLRASKTFGTISEIRLFCADGKSWCMRCRQGSGGHR